MFEKRTLTLREMQSIQQKLNDNIRPGWNDYRSDNYLTYHHFNVAMLDEVSEFLGSVGWKWWKKSDQPNLWNLKIETIDILHFYLSVLIQSSVTSDKEVGASTKVSSVIDVDGNFNYQSMSDIVSCLLDYPSHRTLHNLLDHVGLNAEETSSLYVAKATLNEIRQSSGYKTGEYKKIIDGVEDNERLEKIINQFMIDKKMTLQSVRDAVEKEFFEVKNKND